MSTDSQHKLLTGGLLCFAAVILIVLAQYAKADTAPGLVVDVPQPGSIQSGIGLIHGWVCGGGTVWVDIDGVPFARVTADAPRWDVARAFPECGPASGFGLPMNWKNLSTGPHSLSVNGIDVPFQVGGFGGYLESDQIDFSQATLAPGFDATFWLYGVHVEGQETNALYRWEPSVQGLSVLSVEPVVDVPDPCGFSPPDPSCQQ